MDFIAMDLDRYDVWEAFIQPVPVQTAIYVKTANWTPSRWSEEVDCNASPHDACFQDQKESSQNLFGGTSLHLNLDHGSETNFSNPENGFDEDGLTSEKMECLAEQSAESERDAATNTAVAEINGLDPNVEHANFIVNLNGTPTPLEPDSGDENNVSTAGLFAQLNSLGLNESHILVDIHSHPGTLSLTDTSAITQDTFVNSFPSAADYIAEESYVSTAVFFGANETQWRENFAHVVISPDDIAREFEDFALPSNQDFPNNGVPAVGTPERTALEEDLEDAKEDAEGTCK